MAEPEKKEKSKTVKVGDILSKDSKKPEKGKESKGDAKGGKKSKMRHTHIEHHSDGSHTVRHTPMSGDEMSYSKPDMEGVIQGLQQHVGGGAEEAPDPQMAAQPQAAAPAAQPMPQQGM